MGKIVRVREGTSQAKVDVERYTPGEAPVEIGRIIRRMRGGSQPQLVQGTDNKFYIAKFLGNPQGSRTLINEWIAYRLLREMGVSTPRIRILQLPESLKAHEDLYFLMGNKRVVPRGVLHLGSQCPVDPEQKVIFDFLSDRLLPKVVNFAEFAIMFAFDKWTGQTDKRQAIFVRDFKVRTGFGLRAHFVDHGHAFDGVHWELHDQPLSGLGLQAKIYSSVSFTPLIEQALRQIEDIKETTLFSAAEGAPASWFAPGDQECLNDLLHKLQRRQANLRPIIQSHLRALRDTFGIQSTGSAFSRAM